MIFDIVTFISIILAMLSLKSLVNVFPSLAACLIRSKESFNLEASVKLSRSRDAIALAMIAPACLLAAKYRMYDPSFMSSFCLDTRLGIISGIFLTYVLFRFAVSRLIKPLRMPKKTYQTADKASHTFFTILTLILLACCGIMSMFDAGESAIKSAMLWISAIVYLLFLVRKLEIFNSSCSVFTAFLYLCALEIVPTGTLVVSAIIFS